MRWERKFPKFSVGARPGFSIFIMQLPKAFVIFLLGFYQVQAFGQEIDLSIKPGVAKLLGPPRSARVGFAYLTNPPPSPYPALYFEANKRNVFKKTNLIAGIGFLPTFSHISLNTNNIKNGHSIEAALIIYALQLHIGVEKLMHRDHFRINKNIFSIIGAIGFNMSGNLGETKELNDGGHTQSNEVFQGTKVSFQHASFFGPILIGGGRYHIRNRKGNEILGIDLLLTHNLSQYYDHKFSYTIDNIPTTEVIPEKGFSIQLLFVKRLFWLKKTH